MKEEWRPVGGRLRGWDYEVSSLGRIRSSGGVKFLTPGAGGYLQSHFCHYGKSIVRQIHRVVAEAFMWPPPEGKTQVNHIDGDKTNNRLDNLEWVTRSENLLHYHRVIKPRM